MSRTVVVFHPGALGDVVLAFPAIKRLASRFPGRALVLIARSSVCRLLAECRVIDECVPIESQSCAGLFARVGVKSGDLPSCFKRCDVAVAWVEDVDNSLAHSLRECGVPDVWIQSPFSPTLRKIHQRDRFLETIGEEGAHVWGQDVLSVPSHILESGRIYLAANGIQWVPSLVIVHPGSGSIQKCLRPEKVASLLGVLQGEGMFPVLLEGPADQYAVEAVLRILSKHPPVVRDLDLVQLAGVLAHAQVYIGHDSGVTHLAALLGVRSVAIFGPTDHDRWAPSGSHVSVARGASCVCSSWDTVKNCREKPCLNLSTEEILAAMNQKTTI